MESSQFLVLVIGLVGVAAWLLIRRTLDARVPRWAIGCRLCLLAGCASWGVALFGCAVVAYAVAPVFLLLVIAALLYRLFRCRGFVAGDSCGSARFCDAVDLLLAGAFDGRPGLLLGPVCPPTLRESFRALFSAPASCSLGVVRAFLAAWRKGILWVRLQGHVHAAIFSPTGAGKTSAFAIPHLLTDDDSAVVIDPSGEIYQATAQSRRERGHEIRVLDPAGITGVQSDALNPLAGLHPDAPDFLDLCRAFGDAVVVRCGTEQDPHWAESAALYISAIIAWVVFVATKQTRPDLCNLQSVADILADQKELEAAIAGMQKETSVLGGMLARLGHKLGHAIDRERGSILSTVGRSLAFLDTPAVAAVTSRSTFSAEDLRQKEQTVYLVIPPEQLREKAGLVRLWLTALLRGCVRAGAASKTRAYFLLDEYAALGSRLQCVEDALTQYRKYGVRLFFFLQGTGQLESSFSEGMDKTLLANCTLVFMGVADLDTLKYVSERCGTTTVSTNQQSAGGSWSSGSDSQGTFNRSSGGNDGSSISEKERPLITPDEVASLGDRMAITFAPNLPPIVSHPVRFFEPAFQLAPRGDGQSGVEEIGRAAVVFLLTGLVVAGVSLWVASQVFSTGR